MELLLATDPSMALFILRVVLGVIFFAHGPGSAAFENQATVITPNGFKIRSNREALLAQQ
jgi:uncharacterized membrane protein YphA (DoxX/SURF4 family)